MSLAFFLELRYSSRRNPPSIVPYTLVDPHRPDPVRYFFHTWGSAASRKDGREMGPSRFDDLTKTLATATSRRQALKTLAATALGGLLGLGGIGTAFANCKPNGIGCNSNSQCCSGGCCKGICTDLGTTSNCGACGHKCGANQTCQNGQCVTPCTANGDTCSGNSDCCSGNCSNGVCCASGRVGLCNGSCALPCDPDVGCSDGCSSSYCLPDVSGAYYCSPNNVNSIACDSTCTCPVGTYCEDDNIVCTVLC